VEQEIAHYTCHRTGSPGRLDGKADDAAWLKAPRSPRFVDMVTGEPGYFDTRAAALWDDDNLYVTFWVEEPFPEAHMIERDGIVFAENDVEIFIDGGDAYYEFELNAANTVYEVFFIWQDAYRRGGRFDIPEFDLVDRQALTFGATTTVRPPPSGEALIHEGSAGHSASGTCPGCAPRFTSTGSSTSDRSSARAGMRRSCCHGRAWRRWPTAGHCRPGTATSGACSSVGSRRSLRAGLRSGLIPPGAGTSTA